MLLAGEKSIREVIAFPKTTAAQDLMAESPSAVGTDQLDDLGIAIKQAEIGNERRRMHDFVPVADWHRNCSVTWGIPAGARNATLSLRVQFMVLLGLGVTIGFIFLVMVQMRSFPEWFGVSLMLVVFVASLFGTRIFLRSLSQEDKKTEDEAREEYRRGPEGSRLADPRSARHTP